MWYPFNQDQTNPYPSDYCYKCEPLENGCKETWCRVCEKTRFYFHMGRWVEIEGTNR